MNSAPNALVEAIRVLAAGRPLDPELCRRAIGAILEGEASAAQIGGFLIGLRVKGESIDEIAGLAQGLREHGLRVEPRRTDAVDLCGTGGDGSGTVNLSTAAALVAAAAGVPVAKHGNRSATSRCGSADVLEAMGIPIDLGPDDAARTIDEQGFAFLFARIYHPAMRHAAQPRSELGTRTVFNLLGPLANPARVRRQLIGVYADELRRPLAEVARLLGSELVWVVHGDGGLDELGISGATRVSRLEGGSVAELEVVPEDAGLSRHPIELLRGGDAAENARILARVFARERGPALDAVRDAVLLNAAAAIVIHGSAADLREGARRAAEAIDSGGVSDLVARLRRRT
jgi:anthranilate phosphoribosyltransferase